MGTYMTGNPRISGHRVPSRLAVCGRCGHCPQSTMSTASFYDLQSDAIQVVLHVFIQNVHLLNLARSPCCHPYATARAPPPP